MDEIAAMDKEEFEGRKVGEDFDGKMLRDKVKADAKRCEMLELNDGTRIDKTRILDVKML